MKHRYQTFVRSGNPPMRVVLTHRNAVWLDLTDPDAYNNSIFSKNRKTGTEPAMTHIQGTHHMNNVYAVISDIHGDSKCLSSALKTLESYDISFYLLLGDLINHGPRNGLSREYNPLGIPELLNPLRHDSEVDQKLCEFPLTAPVNTLIIGGHRAVMTHGHIWKPADTEKLALSRNDIFMSGHTHMPVLERNSRGVIIFNPGSLTFPKGPNGIHTMGIIDEKSGTVSLLDISGKKLNTVSFLEQDSF